MTYGHVALSARPFGKARRLRVLMLLDWHFYYAAAIARGLAKSADVLVVTREHGYEIGVPGDAAGEKTRMLGTQVRSEFLRGRQGSVEGARTLVKARGAVCAFSPDVIHAQIHVDWRLYLVQRAVPDVPVCVTVHDVVPHLGSRERPNLGQRIIERRLLDRAHAVIVHGESLALEARRQPWHTGRQSVYVIPHVSLGGVASDVTPGVPPTVLFFGRMEYYKGLDVLVEAAKLAAASIPRLRVVIAGQGPEGERVRASTDPGRLFEWRLGFVEDTDVPELLAEVHAVVLPYREASQSGVASLAFGHGRPVIATRVGGLPEAVEDEVDGLLVPAGDPRLLADAMVRFFCEDGLARRLTTGAALKGSLGAMSPARVADLHLKVYESMLGSRCDHA